MKIQGKREILEAVAIAALSAAVTGLINWGLEAAKAAREKAAEKGKGESS